MDKCNSALSLVSNIWKKFESSAPKSATDVAKVVNEIVGQYNHLVGNTPLALGPRPMLVDQQLDGDLVLAGERLFTGVEPLPKPGTIHVTKVEGKGRAEFTVCAFDEKGEHQQVGSFVIDDTTPDGKAFNATVPSGKIPVLHADSTTVLKHIKYTVKLTLD